MPKELFDSVIDYIQAKPINIKVGKRPFNEKRYLPSESPRSAWAAKMYCALSLSPLISRRCFEAYLFPTFRLSLDASPTALRAAESGSSPAQNPPIPAAGHFCGPRIGRWTHPIRPMASIRKRKKQASRVVDSR